MTDSDFSEAVSELDMTDQSKLDKKQKTFFDKGQRDIMNLRKQLTTTTFTTQQKQSAYQNAMNQLSFASREKPA